VTLTTYHPCSAECQVFRGLNLPGIHGPSRRPVVGDLYLYLFIRKSKLNNKRWDEVDIIKKQDEHSPIYEMDDRSFWLVFPVGTIEVSFSATLRLPL
jgi:hypothetical protein